MSNEIMHQSVGMPIIDFNNSEQLENLVVLTDENIKTSLEMAEKSKEILEDMGNGELLQVTAIRIELLKAMLDKSLESKQNASIDMVEPARSR